jgi:dTDP-4-dehydrorhamnose 3,5-epimerase-like enzyme
MRKWKQKMRSKKYGICTVVEHTDKECTASNKKGGLLAPVSHGFVILYKDNVFVAWCGQFYAEEHLIKE